MINYKLTYVSGVIRVKTFTDECDAILFVRHAGDSLLKVERMIDEQWDPFTQGTGPAYTFLD